MGKLFGNMWNSAPTHYANTPLVLTEYPEVFGKIKFNVFISKPRYSLNSFDFFS
jgi:hypothetical protein